MREPSLALQSLAAVSAMVKARKISPVELVQECLTRIAKYDSVINAFISVHAEEGFEQARVAEQEITRGQWRGPLHGIPVALKDLIDLEVKTTIAASALFLNNVADQITDVVNNLV